MTNPNRKVVSSAVKGMVSSVHPPAVWRWWHTLMAILAVIFITGLLFFPLEMALIFGWEAINADNALFVRAGVGGFALWVALVVRGQPWYHATTCVAIAAFCGGQIARAAYIPGGIGIPVSLCCAYVAFMVFLLTISFRPNVYERLEDSDERVVRLEAKNKQLQDEIWRIGQQSKHFELSLYAEQGKEKAQSWLGGGDA